MADKSRQSVEIYDHISEAYADSFNEPSEHIDDFLNLIKSGGKILDLGCGPGVDSSYMASKGFDVVGVDLSERMLELAKAKNSKIQFLKADIRELTFEPESFDGNLASYSFIHIEKKDVSGVISSLYKLLKNDGVISVGIQEGESKELFITEPLKPDEKIFINVMSADELRQLLTDHGFVIINEFMRKAENDAELNFNKFCLIARKVSL